MHRCTNAMHASFRSCASVPSFGRYNQSLLIDEDQIVGLAHPQPMHEAVPHLILLVDVVAIRRHRIEHRLFECERPRALQTRRYTHAPTLPHAVHVALE